MLTEQEARNKICPFLGTEKDSLPDPYTEEYGVSPLLCRGSRCMAWRFTKLPVSLLTIPHAMTADERLKMIQQDLPDPPRPSDVPEGYVFTVSPGKAAWVESEESAKTRRKGYCGLVGLPEPKREARV